MTEFKNSQTKENLMRAFAGESQARNRYTFAAAVAHGQGMPLICEVFSFTAAQEKEHAEVFYDLLKPLNDTTIAIDGTYPVNISDNLLDLLTWAEHNEYHEYSEDYKNFAQVAAEEGFKDIAAKFSLIAEIEKTHSERYHHLAELLKTDRLFSGEGDSCWLCLNCGHIHRGKKVPEKCPVCRHERGYFIKAELSPYNFGGIR